VISPPTQRELEVLDAYIRAGSVKAAAQDMGITEQSAKNHLASLRRRLGATNTAQAFAIAIKRGFLTERGTHVTVQKHT
jgi:DNA-binding NarL/FixJ family response regulator